MKLLTFLIKHAPVKFGYVLKISLLYGLTAGAFGPLVIHAATDILAGTRYAFYLGLLPAAIAVMILSQWIARSQTEGLTEEIAEILVMRLVNTLRHDELPEFERRNRSKIYLGLADTQVISKGAVGMMTVLQNVLVLAVGWLYLFSISGLSGVAVLLTWLLLSEIRTVLLAEGRLLAHQTHDTERSLFDLLDHFFNGFKEIRIFPHKHRDLFHNYLIPFTHQLQRFRQNTTYIFSSLGLYGGFITSLLVGIEVFLLSASMQVVIITIYIMKPVAAILGALGDITQGQAAFERLDPFLHEAFAEEMVRSEDEPLTTFEQLSLKNVLFAYREHDDTLGFSIGPLNLTVNAGELVFISGGNGSGKSTLMKLVTGLYPPTSGTVLIDGEQVNLSEHRHLFSAIFSDVHLFDALYGIEADEPRIHDLLTQMELAHKVSHGDGRFSTLELSTGQRKRLALVVALLEDKPVYMFDEWAAEQDPRFRRYFYEDLLPSLKEQGKTVLVVTHDDRYYHLGDRVIVMEHGRITDEWKARQIPTGTDSGPLASRLPTRPLTGRTHTTFSDPAQHPDEPDESVFDVRQFAASLKRLAWLTPLQGISTTLRTHIIFTAVGLAASPAKHRLFLLFIVLLLLFPTVRRRIISTTVQTTETFIGTIRLKVVDRLRRAEYPSFEQFGPERIRTILTADLRQLSGISESVATLSGLLFTCMGLLAYIAYLVWPIFLLEIGMIGTGGLWYLLMQLRARQAIYRVREEETAFSDTITNFLDGFKELRLNDRKNDAFFAKRVRPLYSRLRSLRLSSKLYMLMNTTCLVSGIWIMLLGMIPLALPWIGMYSDKTVLTCIGVLSGLPIEGIANAVHRVFLAFFSVRRLTMLQQDVERLEPEPVSELPVERHLVFQELRCQDIEFYYQNERNDSFSIGPLDLKVQAGEVLFLTGGNGSGKSTLLKVLTGLYMPDAGQIMVNGQHVDMRQHRYLFAPIFGDVHLFDRFYGLSGVDEQRVSELLGLMQLDQKVQFADGRFSNLDLSTGQRKRLAMVEAMIEDRQIYVFDEWAAEQDPQFREYFYTGLLGELKAQGKTVIAVTHDDRYFHVADQVMNMDYGRMI
ncbi:MAG: hypothetical protein B6245_09925 [Desulfobacteraceae bacterium 4572_88]|nr:MAG: hypothetical protein B6245_09925 [Desulfobacteraceae bacterium 4572_88]